MWIPLSVLTGAEISPTFKAKAVSSNGFYIYPLSKNPKSPFLPADIHSLYSLAILANSPALKKI